MSDESIQATAENLRADFLNATSTAERWKVLNRTIEWAVAASENTDRYRQKAQTGWVRHGERIISDGQNTLRGGDRVSLRDKEGVWVVLGFSEAPLVDLVRVRDDYRHAWVRASVEDIEAVDED